MMWSIAGLSSDDIVALKDRPIIMRQHSFQCIFNLLSIVKHYVKVVSFRSKIHISILTAHHASLGQRQSVLS